MLPTNVVDKTIRDIAALSADWKGEHPLRIHMRALGPDGCPQLAPEFLRWLSCEPERASEDVEAKLRLTRSMKNLRKIAPREYDVLHRVFAGETTEQIRDWLNDRAIRGGHWTYWPGYCRSAFRFRYSPDFRSGTLGFRPASKVSGH